MKTFAKKIEKLQMEALTPNQRLFLDWLFDYEVLGRDIPRTYNFESEQEREDFIKFTKETLLSNDAALRAHTLSPCESETVKSPNAPQGKINERPTK